MTAPLAAGTRASFAIAGSRKCSCGKVDLPHGLPRRERTEGNRFHEHFADHACLPWCPRSKRLVRLTAIACRTGEQWERMSHYNAQWKARVFASYGVR